MFFARNPEEILTIEDAQHKWGVTYHAAQAAMYRLEKSGWLQRTEPRRVRSKATIYEIGPTMKQELREK